MNKELPNQVTQLNLELREMKRLLFGRKSERFVPLDTAQTAQLDLALQMHLATQVPAVKEEMVVVKKKSSDHKPTGRQPIPENIERVNIYLEPDIDTSAYKKNRRRTYRTTGLYTRPGNCTPVYTI